MKIFLSILTLITASFALEIKQKPIIFDDIRVQLTKEYVKQHYNLLVSNITITPKIIVVHHTGIDDFDKSYNRFLNQHLPNDRPDISKAGKLNVSTHFMIDTSGEIYQLMDETDMARHVIGLNYSSIGIENVGGENFKDNLTQAQLQSNIKLIHYLQKKYPTIKQIIGHYEYRDLENSTLWLENDSSYRTVKHDPSPRFMNELRERIRGLISE